MIKNKSYLLVESILRNNERSRSDDKELEIQALKAQGVNLNFYQEQAIRRAFSFETIRRYRQKIQESGLYPPDEKTRRGRKLKQEKMRIEMKKKEYIPQYDAMGKLQGYLIK